MIEIKNLFLKYIREYYALYDINLKIENGESVMLVGNEGSGKTTLLRVLSKLEKYAKGEVYVKDINLKKVNFKDDVDLGYVAGEPIFLKNKTVGQNLRYVLKSRKYKEFDIEEKVNSTVIEYNLEKFSNMMPSELNLYEKYVIALIRLSLRPLDIVLIDDVFKNLNDEQKQVIVALIDRLFVSKNITTLVATSDENLLKDVCKRTVKFEHGSIV